MVAIFSSVHSGRAPYEGKKARRVPVLRHSNRRPANNAAQGQARAMRAGISKRVRHRGGVSMLGRSTAQEQARARCGAAQGQARARPHDAARLGSTGTSAQRGARTPARRKGNTAEQARSRSTMQRKTKTKRGGGARLKGGSGAIARATRCGRG